MRTVELIDTLTNVVEKNPNIYVSFMINEKSVKDFGFGDMEGQVSSI